MNNSKKSFFLPLILICLAFHCASLFAAEDYDASKVAAIKILPYCPDGIFPPNSLPIVLAASALPAMQHDLAQHYRRYMTTKTVPESNEFKLGKSFSYLKKDEFTALHMNDVHFFMRQLVSKYIVFREETNLNSNVLFVRMRITATPHALPSAAASSTAPISAPAIYEYFLGLFVSGSQNFKGGTVRDLTGSFAVQPSQAATSSESATGSKPQKKSPPKLKADLESIPISLKKSVEYAVLSNIWSNITFQKFLKEYTVIKDEDVLTPENAEDLLSEIVYSIKLFNFDIMRQKRTFTFISYERFGRLTDVMNLRLFNFLPAGGLEPPHKMLLNASFNAPPRVTKTKELEETIQYEMGMLNRAKLTADLFGRPSYTDRGELKACLRKESDLDYCFGQSEQAFLSWLEQWEGIRLDVNESDNLYSPSPAAAGRYQILNIQLDLYSYLDVCCFCRGTMAYMLRTGKMAEILHGFIKKLKITPQEELSDSAQISSFSDKIQINAFSYRGTDTA